MDILGSSLWGSGTEAMDIMGRIGMVFGIIAAFAVFFLFMSVKNENRFHGWLGKLYQFLHFRCFIVESILKFLYVFAACTCTGIGLFMVLSLSGIGPGLIILLFGNLFLRILYELILMLIMACRNIRDINRKMGGTVAADELDRDIAEAAAGLEGEAERVCPDCGRVSNVSGAQFCGECGKKL